MSNSCPRTATRKRTHTRPSHATRPRVLCARGTSPIVGDRELHRHFFSVVSLISSGPLPLISPNRRHSTHQDSILPDHLLTSLRGRDASRKGTSESERAKSLVPEATEGPSHSWGILLHVLEGPALRRYIEAVNTGKGHSHFHSRSSLRAQSSCKTKPADPTQTERAIEKLKPDKVTHLERSEAAPLDDIPIDV